MRTKKEINKNIVTEIRAIIARKGLQNKLDVFPVENTFTRRPRYWNDGTINLFSVHMWDFNELGEDELYDEIKSRVSHAVTQFGL